ncbi:MAG: hypothetical protein H6814_07210 [Phycisphaeraceae bacterium]|nr:hypothetical protein [Phycisphaeraceae bacterium]
MNSIERVLAALTFGQSEHGIPDRVPVFPVPLMQGAIVHGMTVEQYFKSPPERLVQAQLKLNEMLGGVPDAVAGIPNVIQDVTAFGIDLAYHYQNSTPATSRMLIQGFDDIASMGRGSISGSKELEKTLEVIRQLSAKVGDSRIVIGACIAPFSMPSMLMGTSKWMRLLFTPELKRRWFAPIIEVCTDFCVEWARAQHRAGAHVVVLADGMASSTMLPRRCVEEWAIPVVRETIARIGGLVAYEPVGIAEPVIDLLADVGAVALLIGEEDDIARCKKKTAGRVGLIGNINNMKMRRWSPARVELKAKAALAQGMPGYGFILANQGPEIPFDTPVANIAALVEAVEKYGRYAPRAREKASVEREPVAA